MTPWQQLLSLVITSMVLKTQIPLLQQVRVATLLTREPHPTDKTRAYSRNMTLLLLWSSAAIFTSELFQRFWRDFSVKRFPTSFFIVKMHAKAKWTSFQCDSHIFQVNSTPRSEGNSELALIIYDLYQIVSLLKPKLLLPIPKFSITACPAIAAHDVWHILHASSSNTFLQWNSDNKCPHPFGCANTEYPKYKTLYSPSPK